MTVTASPATATKYMLKFKLISEKTKNVQKIKYTDHILSKFLESCPVKVTAELFCKMLELSNSVAISHM